MDSSVTVAVTIIDEQPALTLTLTGTDTLANFFSNRTTAIGELIAAIQNRGDGVEVSRQLRSLEGFAQELEAALPEGTSELVALEESVDANLIVDARGTLFEARQFLQRIKQATGDNL